MPAHKLDLTFKEIVHDCNAITKHASSDLEIGETTLEHKRFGHVSNGFMK